MRMNNLFTAWPNWRWIAVGLVAVLALAAGCGDVMLTSDSGSSGGGQIIGGIGSGGTGVVRTAMLKPAEGTGLIDAVVFMDKNGNRLPDADEPFATTDQDGNYVLQAVSTDVASYPLLLQAVAGRTVVKATGEVVSGSYVIDVK